MNIEKMREDESRKVFEAYRDERNAGLESEGHAPGSKWHVTNAHYPTWKASRESLVVHLPFAFDQDLRDQIQECRDSIHAAGVKTK